MPMVVKYSSTEWYTFIALPVEPSIIDAFKKNFLFAFSEQLLAKGCEIS